MSQALQLLRPGLAEQHDLDVYQRMEPALDALCGAYAYRALRSLGWAAAPGTRSSSGDLAQALGILPAHRRLLERLLDILREDGALAQRGSLWTVLAHPEPVDPDEALRALLAAYPSCRGELAMLGRCGPALADLLTGRADALLAVVSQWRTG